MLSVLPKCMVVACPITLIFKGVIDAVVDLLYVYFEIFHDVFSALVSDLHLFIQACEVDVVEVVEEYMDIPFILHVTNYLVETFLSKILSNELSFGHIAVRFGAISIWRSEAEAAIGDAVLILDLLRAHGALERQNARN